MKVLSLEQQKLATLCTIEGYEKLDQLMEAAASDSVSPAICMTEGCDYVADFGKDQTQGVCEACGCMAASCAAIAFGAWLTAGRGAGGALTIVDADADGPPTLLSRPRAAIGSDAGASCSASIASTAPVD